MSSENIIKNEEPVNTNNRFKNLKRIFIILVSLIVIGAIIFTIIFFVRKNKSKKSDKNPFQFKKRRFANSTVKSSKKSISTDKTPLHQESTPKYSNDTFEQCQEYINKEVDKIKKINDFFKQKRAFSNLRPKLPLKPLAISNLSSLFLYTRTSPAQVLKRAIYDEVIGTYEDDICNFFKGKSEHIINILKSSRTTRMVPSPNNLFKKEKQTIMWMFFDLLDVEVDFLHVGKNEKIIRNIMHDALMGLKCMHDHNYAHLDIKMQNIMGSTKKGKVTYKLIDLGLSHYFPNKFKKMPGLGMGTFPFFAPEICASNIHGVKADIWSIGATAWYLSLRSIPFVTKQGHPDYPKYGKFINHGLTSLVLRDNHRFVFRRETSPELRNFVMKSMDLDWNKRPSADKLLEHPFIQNKKLINAPADSFDIYDSSFS